ncbi:endonuclease V [Halorubrum sp. AD140]|uniref:endonuclease V n=1 Tax=Halorubrum sp. AD140 TaxID=3050073 RepID=UPI002ACCC780|nr:endonuclease V [Halorubrum sp. AD140]MDZ5811003.1 endonuclease V [Halorubrum sp. AD140]
MAPSIGPDAVARPEFLPDPALSRAEMESLQRELAAAATFADDHELDPAAVAIEDPADLSGGLPPARPDAGAPDSRIDPGLSVGPDPDAPVVVGVDQAFLTPEDGEDRAVSAAVAVRDGAVIEYASATTPLSIPYVPGLLAFREGEPMLAALAALDADPDLLVCDGSGRIHFREAGIATHVGVLLDVPSVGVAKRLLCGEPASTTAERPEGWRTPIRADGSVETADPDAATVIGHAFQSRQYPNSRRVNPLYVSPGHRVSAETTVELVEALCAGYKLPEPTRLADAHADAVKRERD